MSREYFENRIKEVTENHRAVTGRKNRKKFSINGVFNRYEYPALMREDIPLNWRFDYSYERNPMFLERIRVNAILNAGGIFLNGKYVLVARVEGNDRKSYFAVAESDNGIDGFKFREKPIKLPETDEMDTNVYDMRLTKHEDGWIYGLFCSERKDFSGCKMRYSPHKRPRQLGKTSRFEVTHTAEKRYAPPRIYRRKISSLYPSVRRIY